MFYIDENNSIGVPRTLAGQVVDVSDGDALFGSFAEFEKVAESRKWTKQTVTDIWNGFAGVSGKFADLKPWTGCCKNRPYGLQRIWDAIQRLVPAEAVSEPVTPAKAETSECPDCNGTGENCANCGGPAGECVCSDADEEMGTCDTCGGSGQVDAEPEQSTTPILDTEVKVKKPKNQAKAKKAAKPEPPKVEKSKGKTKRDEVIRLMRRARGASAEELMAATGWLPHSLRGAISTMGSKGGLAIISEKDEKRGRVYRIAA